MVIYYLNTKWRKRVNILQWFTYLLFDDSGNETEFRKFLNDGNNLNATDENGNSALLLAAERGI